MMGFGGNYGSMTNIYDLMILVFVILMNMIFMLWGGYRCWQHLVLLLIWYVGQLRFSATVCHNLITKWYLSGPLNFQGNSINIVLSFLLNWESWDIVGLLFTICMFVCVYMHTHIRTNIWTHKDCGDPWLLHCVCGSQPWLCHSGSHLAQMPEGDTFSHLFSWFFRKQTSKQNQTNKKHETKPKKVQLL